MNRQEIDEKIELYTKKAKKKLEGLSLKEKIALMSGNQSIIRIIVNGLLKNHYNCQPIPAAGNKRLEIPALEFCDGPRGVVCGNSTCFPVSMARGASWDVQLERRIGKAIGREIRAHGGNLFGGVCINLLRHPAGGRAQETYGEDPFHVGQMGAALTSGVQEVNVIACVKHFALNNQENTRYKINVDCSERTLREVYLPHFKDCIEAGAGSIMASYNKFRDEYACHNKFLLTEIIKEEWDFYGFVLSDFFRGVRDTVAAARAGLDVEMPRARHYGKRLLQAVEEGEVAKEVVEEAALRIVRTVLLFSEASDSVSSFSESTIACPEHRKLAREAAEKSIVLLKNKKKLLPLDKQAISRVALIGELADKPNLGDHGSSRVRPPQVVTLRQGLSAYLGSEVELVYTPGEDSKKVQEICKQADIAILVVGCTYKDEGEYIDIGPLTRGGDRKSLELSSEEERLIKQAAQVNQNTAVILNGGSAFLMSGWEQEVPVILHAFYPGMEGGTALAKIIFGEVNPSGKLPFSIPEKQEHLPEFDREAEEVEYGMYHGYTYLDKKEYKPAYPFGFGLSYTEFEVSSPSLFIKDGCVFVSVILTNKGRIYGEEVVQLYIGFENSAVERPRKQLKGFKKVGLKPLEAQEVEIVCPLEKIKYYDSYSGEWKLEDIEYQVYIGTSSSNEDLLEGTFTV